MFVYLFNWVVKNNPEDQNQNFNHANQGLHWDASSTILYLHFCVVVLLFSLCMWAQMHTTVQGQPQKLAFTSHLVLKQCLFIVLLLCTSGLSVPKILGILQFPTPIPSWVHWNYRHSLLCPAFTCVLVFELGSSYLCTRHLTHWAIYPALMCCFYLFLWWTAKVRSISSLVLCVCDLAYILGFFFLVHHRWVAGILIHP